MTNEQIFGLTDKKTLGAYQEANGNRFVETSEIEALEGERLSAMQAEAAKAIEDLNEQRLIESNRRIAEAMEREKTMAYARHLVSHPNDFSDGDFDAAVTYLREKGLASAAKKATRVAAEGVAYATVIDGIGVIVEVNCESDFVASSPVFTPFVEGVAAVIAKSAPASVEALMACPWIEEGKTVDDESFARSLEELSWHLIQEKLVEKYGIKVEDEDVKQMAREATRAQFAQYGMMNIPDEMLDNYSKEMLKKRETVDGLVNRAVETKLSAALKEQVKLNVKKVSVEEFNKLFEK